MSPEQVPAKAGRYRRCGTVIAHRLEHGREWATTHGDVLRSEAGDWWVVSKAGGERGVTAAEFPKLYAHVSDDLYRRIGEVHARPVLHTEEIDSLEGHSVADPGSWVVTDDRGHSWVVPDSGFRGEYAPVDS